MHKPHADSSGPSVHGAGSGSASDLAEVEARLRDVVRAEKRLEARERELAESSAAMARELRETAERLREREAEAASTRSIPTRLQDRRRRLARVRAVLRDRASKLQRYEVVLEDRAREADQVLAQRREVAQAAAAIKVKHDKLVALQARNKTLSSSFFAVAAIAILGVLSFAVADHIAPATYAAAAEIQVDARGRALSADEIDEWQRYIEGLLTDPGLLEIAADRMKKRGIISLGRAADLRVALDSSLTSASPAPGRLTLEYVGEGSGATQRVLDTYLVALISQSNATKNQRAGGSGSRVAQDAAVSGPAIEDQRMTYAAGIGGGATTVAALIGWTIYTRLRKQQNDFERGVID
ncbi:MAG: hypothetical protein AAGF47_00620 [Planctomycetota bacterium]